MQCDAMSNGDLLCMRLRQVDLSDVGPFSATVAGAKASPPADCG
jgi:hypothetical protein